MGMDCSHQFIRNEILWRMLDAPGKSADFFAQVSQASDLYFGLQANCSSACPTLPDSGASQAVGT